METETKVQLTKGEYNKNYYKNNVEIWKQKIFCKTCQRDFTNSNKSHHMKTKRHELNLLKEKHKIIEELLEYLKK